MRILILGAFQAELKSITQQFSNLKDTIIARRRCSTIKTQDLEMAFSLSGLGTTSAACTTTALCENFDPDLIILCGVAGGLESSQKIGDLVLATKIIDADLYESQSILKGTPYEPCLTDPHTLKPTTSAYQVHPLLIDIGASINLSRLNTGIVATSNIFPAPKELFSAIKALGCSAIEMESVGVFKAAEHYGIPVMTIRAISNLLDNSGDDLGTEVDALAICSERIALFLTSLLNKTKKLEELAQLSQQKKISEIVMKYELTQHPEGGWYRQTYRSSESVSPMGASLVRYDGKSRVAGTSILYLLAKGDFSAWHTVQSDETWNFHLGEPLLLRVIDPDSKKLEEIVLGLDTLQYTVKAGHVFSAESMGKFSLTGCMVTPGFEFRDFRLLSRTEFCEKYPQHKGMARLARDRTVVDIHETPEMNVLSSNFFSIKKPCTETDKLGSSTAIRSML